MEGEIRIYGKVTGLEGELIQGAEVSIKDSGFRDIAKGKSNDLGEYEFYVQAGQYTALSAVAEKGVSYLPYWEWNFSKMEDCEINITLGCLELFAANVMVPDGTFPQFMIYFRPVSLAKSLAYKKGTKANKGETINIAPELTIDDISLTINDEPAKVFTLSKVEEFAGDFKLAGYFMATQRPINLSMEDYTVIKIKIKDDVSEETGECVIYW